MGTESDSKRDARDSLVSILVNRGLPIAYAEVAADYFIEYLTLLRIILDK